jgi:2-keto-3-deoxy-L-rhamnonate aldolase RhmA
VWIPFVESRADLERAISAVRGAETSAMAGMNIPRERRDVWPLNPQGELIVVAMIESDEGARHAEEIASTPGVTAIQPVHLSDSDTARVVKICRERKVITATDATPADIKARIAEGYRLISVGWDFGLLRDALASTVKSMRSAIR